MERMNIECTIHNEDGSTETILLPAKYEVCDRCKGKGTQDVWDNGMTADEMYEQGSEFIEDYWNGVYDKTCETCKGQRVVKVVAEDQIPAPLKARYEANWYHYLC